MRTPYPGFAPNYREVGTIGGYTRTCFVIEFLSLGSLDSAQISIIEEQMGALAEKLRNNIITVEKVDFVTPDRFDPKVKEGLRLPK